MDWTKAGQAAPLRDPVRLRRQALGKPSPRHHLPLPCLLAFNVTVRSDRQGTCQGSHVAQACVGHCESSAFPSRYSVLVASGYRHNITSVSQCCTISGLRKVRGLSLAVARWGCGDRGGRDLRWPKKGAWTDTHLSYRWRCSCIVGGTGRRSWRSSRPGPASVTCVASRATSPSFSPSPPPGHRV